MRRLGVLAFSALAASAGCSAPPDVDVTTAEAAWTSAPVCPSGVTLPPMRDIRERSSQWTMNDPAPKRRGLVRGTWSSPKRASASSIAEGPATPI